ncbi:response regulator [Pedosphaera parvula]|uniref:Response regulator receiver protein n=1 Tax=Pedosphaera parvula (strain Ellin514) TaxID=320771 RepID=B9XJU1_PEDPL|nr:response regulator [Pedosphaera parvula]EEF59967.1 response regulator receiver protein [Pedosphaera parvula Ellin514]
MHTVKPILLVEDNEDDVFFMKRAAKTAEIADPLLVATDGQEAIDFLSGTGIYADRDKYPIPSLVLLDLKLPRKSGHEVLQWIRAQSQFKTLIVIILSTSREGRDVELAYQSGANSYLVKPTGSPQLTEMARSLKDYWLKQNVFAP